MSKYMRSRHVPLVLEETKAIQEAFEVFSSTVLAAGTTLQTLRESQGWTQRELGEKVGMDETHIALMEVGEQPIPIVIAKRFAEIFHIDYQRFL